MDTRGFVRGSRIGSGSFGTVSLAFNRSDGRQFAVKSVDLNSSHPTAVASLENEIRILRSLDSPYVVSYLGDSTTVESLGTTLRNLHVEYLPGGTLADLAPYVAESDVRVYALCVARALAYLHSSGLVHSDVKGRNVLVGPVPGSAKLADFGSAGRAGETPSVGGGTPLWMAPEVVRGEPPAPASDIWSFGCTVIEMANGGGSPWRSEDPQCLVVIGYGTELPEFPPRMSKLGRDFLDKCLRRNAEERWTAERLLKHPYLADTADATDTGTEIRLSPRCVLDWANSEFDDNDDHDDDDERVADSARERIRELVWDGETVGWAHDDDGWEVVRTVSNSESIDPPKFGTVLCHVEHDTNVICTLRDTAGHGKISIVSVSADGTKTSGSGQSTDSSCYGWRQPRLGCRHESRLRESMWSTHGWCKFFITLLRGFNRNCFSGSFNFASVSLSQTD